MLKNKIDTSADEYITDPTIPAIAKEMNCGANFEYKFKTNVYSKGKKLNEDEIERLYRLIMNL